MTPLLPIDRFSPTSLTATIPARCQPRTGGGGGGKDEPTLPGYKILRMLGQGGTATVYKARQLCPKRLVAVKVINRSLAAEEEVVARFRQEQALGVRLSHPNLIRVYQAGRAAGRPYLILEFV